MSDREQYIKALQATGLDRASAEHTYDQQIEPRERVARLRRQGHDVTVGVVKLDPVGEGHLVVCIGGCGRAARLSFPLPPGRIIVCPDCARREGFGD